MRRAGELLRGMEKQHGGKKGSMGSQGETSTGGRILTTTLINAQIRML